MKGADYSLVTKNEADFFGFSDGYNQITYVVGDCAFTDTDTFISVAYGGNNLLNLNVFEGTIIPPFSFPTLKLRTVFGIHKRTNEGFTFLGKNSLNFALVKFTFLRKTNKILATAAGSEPGIYEIEIGNTVNVLEKDKPITIVDGGKASKIIVQDLEEIPEKPSVVSIGINGAPLEKYIFVFDRTTTAFDVTTFQKKSTKDSYYSVKVSPGEKVGKLNEAETAKEGFFIFLTFLRRDCYRRTLPLSFGIF